MISPVVVMCVMLAAPADYFEINVVDEQTGRGVPLVELETTNHIRYVTDSNGRAAFLEPGLMDQQVFFHVRSHGYEYPADGFGSRGKMLVTKPGTSATLKLRRVNVAERLYRVTGQGIYRDSVLLGKPAPLREPVLNGLVMGSDSVINAVYRGKLHWFWGDTNRPSYPLGNYNAPGATSVLPAEGGLDPSVGVDLTYFVDAKGFARPAAPMPGSGPTWIFGLAVVKDATGRERMFAAYSKIKPPLEAYERGLCEFNDDTQTFEKRVEFPLDAPAQPGGQTLLHTDGGTEYVYFCQPYPLLRVRATAEDIVHLDRYESYTCLASGSKLANSALNSGTLNAALIDRGLDGAARYSWKRNAAIAGPDMQTKLIKSRFLKPEEALLPLVDVVGGKPVAGHAGSVYWNDYRGRYVMIVTQHYGSTSLLGEVWYAEADTPLGPWVFARKILTHDNYSFYNPKQHPMFDQQGGRVIYFEGTYTNTFSGTKTPTQRYDYNQLMHGLDLADERLALPVPVYQLADSGSRHGLRELAEPARVRRPVVFYALDRPRAGSVPVVAVQDAQDRQQLVIPAPSSEAPTAALFHALPADMQDPPPHTAPLWAYDNAATGEQLYTTDANWTRPNFTRAAKPLCRVWMDPRTPRGP